jgi:hypothetical protein
MAQLAHESIPAPAIDRAHEGLKRLRPNAATRGKGPRLEPAMNPSNPSRTRSQWTQTACQRQRALKGQKVQSQFEKKVQAEFDNMIASVATQLAITDK